MVLCDASGRRWLGAREPPCCLMAALDDAAGKGVAARSFPFECSAGYLRLLRREVQTYGIGLSIYQWVYQASAPQDPL